MELDVPATKEGSVTNPGPSVVKSSDHDPSDVQKIILHILSPSLEAPNRITFEDLPVALTVAELKARITQAMPSKPHASQQRLIYRGKPLLNDSLSLRQVLEPPEALVHTLHLVLPPRPHPTETSSTSVEAGNTGGAGMQPNGTTGATPSPAPGIPQQNQGLRFRGPPPQALRGQMEPHLAALRRDLETIRRHAAQFQARPPQPIHRPGETPQLPGNWHAQPPSALPLPSAARTTTFPPNNEQNSTANTNGASTSVPTSAASIVSSLQSLDYETRRLRLFTLQHQIVMFELQLARGIAPPLDDMIAVRNQLNDTLDEQHRNLAVIRDNFAEMLLTRITNAYVRADQIRQLQFRSTPQRSSYMTTGASFPNNITSPERQTPAYILSSPSGYQALVTGSGDQITQPASATLTGAATGQDPARPAQAVMENVVRQAIINQAAGNQNQADDVFGRNARRLWLFIRLYFFCYLFSESGTWTRIIFITFALVVSFLSETGLPTRFYQAVLDPVQRHLEGLIHAGGDDAVQQPAASGIDAAGPNPDTSGAATGTNDSAPRPNAPRIQQNIRRVERSIALFIASLVPGVGERHVEARNARNARNAELQREEDERRRAAEAGVANPVAEAAAEASTATGNQRDAQADGQEQN